MQVSKLGGREMGKVGGGGMSQIGEVQWKGMRGGLRGIAEGRGGRIGIVWVAIEVV